MKCQILFSGKNKKNISKCRLLKILPRVLSVKADSVKTYQQDYLICNFGKCLFVCVEILQPSQPDGVMLGTVSLSDHTYTGRLSPSIVHIHSPETDNCHS